jgi:hypothetical protein
MLNFSFSKTTEGTFGTETSFKSYDKVKSEALVHM